MSPILGSIGGLSARGFGLQTASAAQFALVGSYDALGTVTVPSGGVSSISFTGIPQTGYRNLVIRAIVQATNSGSADGQFTAYFNGDTTNANYYAHNIYGTGASTGAQSLPGSSYNGAIVGWASATSAAAPMANIISILDYSNTNKNKVTRTLAGFDNNGNGEIDFTSSLWMSTAAINSLVLTPSSGNFKQYSQFALYGER